MRYKLICLFLLLGFVANAQYLHLLERADSSSRKVVVTNNSGIQRYVEVDSLATLLGVNGSVDSLAIVQDTIVVYFRSGSELGRDTIGTYNRSQIDSKDALRVLYTDTADMLLPYITEVEVNDTLGVYYLSSQVDSADALRVLYTDTAAMLSSYTRRTELQDTASAIRSDLGADIGAKTDTTTFNALELVYNPNSQPILNKHYREVDKQTIYIEEINNAAQCVSRLLNTTLTSGRNAYQDAEVVWMADNSDSTVTYSNKGADFTLSRNGNIYGKDNEGAWFEWLNDYPNIDFQENKQKAGLRLFSYIDYGFYRSRVEADTGTLYSIDTCTQNKIDMSLSSSITMIPDGAKAGKLYSIFPNDGSGDFSVTRATTATRVNEEGLIEEVAANVPRIDHTNGCPDLLIEPQRTNLVSYGESVSDWNNFIPGGSSLTITENATTSIIKDSLAERIQIDVTGGDVVLRAPSFSATSGVDYSISFWAKSNSTNYTIDFLRLSAANGSSSDALANDIVLTNEWQKYEYTVTRTFTITSVLFINFAENADISITAVQVEQGSYPTSYIPTEGTSVTRNADEIELTGVADLLGDSEGTLYFEGSFSEDTDDRLSLSDGTDANFMSLDIIAGQFRLLLLNSSAVEASIIGGSANLNTNYKFALKYANNNFALYVDGIKIGEDLSGSTFTSNTLTDIKFSNGSGSLKFYGNVKQLTVFPTALTDTQLKNITQ